MLLAVKPGSTRPADAGTVLALLAAVVCAALVAIAEAA